MAGRLVRLRAPPTAGRALQRGEVEAAVDMHTFLEKAHNGVYKAWWYPRIYLPGCVPVLVYTMTKSGTTMLRNTLYRAGLGPVFWAHSMNREWVARKRATVAAQGKKPPVNRFWMDRVRDRYIDRQRPLRIVTSMRDGVAREVAHFFQVFRYKHGHSATDYADRIDELLEMFHEEVVEGTPRTSWFSREYDDVLGVPWNASPFPYDQGSQVLRHQNLEVLLLRLETPDPVKERALAEFFELPRLKLYRANVGAKKSYASVYAEFKRQLTLPAAYVESRYRLPEMQYFYSEAERDAFQRKWTGSKT